MPRNPHSRLCGPHGSADRHPSSLQAHALRETDSAEYERWALAATRPGLQSLTRDSLVRASSEGCKDALLARARLTAKNTRSGVAGLSNVTGPPLPNAATAARIASRTDMASINGG